MIYADYNSTTPLGAAASEAMESALKEWGNPSSTHALGRQARALIDKSRTLVAQSCGVHPNEIVFTSGGSESNIMAIFGSFLLDPKNFRMITSTVEHASVKGTCEMIENLGGVIKKIGVLSTGEFDLKAFQEALQDFKPTFVSIMSGNNETGVLFPTQEISELCSARNISFHTDAVQTFGKQTEEHWNIADFISVSSHKVFGPKGVGALIVKKNKKLMAIHPGGNQEIKRRGGTENVIGIVGFGAACTELPSVESIQALEKLRNDFECLLTKSLVGFSINGANAKRIANTSNIRFHGIPNDLLMGVLDLEGICVSGGSACSSGSVSPSQVLTEMGLSKTEAKECLRFSFCTKTKPEDIKRIVEVVSSQVNRIRERRSQK